MTKDEVIAEAARRLGETSPGFLTQLSTVFNFVLDEMAARDAIRSLWTTAAFSFVAAQRNYDTQTISGLTSPHFPRDIRRLIVPAWGPVEGYLERVSEEAFVRFRLASTDSAGAVILNRPERWTLTPNEQTLAVDPAPRADDVIAGGAEILFLKPPAAIAGTANIVEVRQEFIPAIIGGLIKHGLVFQEETLVDRATAIRDYEVALVHMRGEAQRERGRVVKMAYREV